MRFPSGVTDQYLYFVAVDATDFTTRETGLTTFTVYRSRNGGVAAAFTTPTINETDTTNMPGVYELLLDEDMTIDAGDDSQEMVVHITHAGMAPVTRTFELYRPKITAGETLTVGSGIASADVVEWLGTAPATPTVAGVPEVDVTHFNGTAGTFLSGRPEVSLGNVAHGGAAATLTALSIAVTNTAGTAVTLTSSGGNGHGLSLVGNGGGEGLSSQGGATGHGAEFIGGATDGDGIIARAATDGNGLRVIGAATGTGLSTEGGATGVGMAIIGGSTSGNGLNVTVTSGIEINADITGNITGNLSGSVGSVTGAVGSVTGNVTGSVGSLATQAKTDVNAEVVDALATDTYAEPTQGAPAATTTLAAKINYLYKAWRNKSTQTSSTYSLFADDTTTVDQKATVSDDGTTFTRGEVATGP